MSRTDSHAPLHVRIARREVVARPVHRCARRECDLPALDPGGSPAAALPATGSGSSPAGGLPVLDVRLALTPKRYIARRPRRTR